MRVRVLRSFVAVIPSPRESRERTVRGVKGEVINMPPGVDWIKAGLVTPADGEKMPPAVPPLPIGKFDFEEEEDDDGEDQEFKFKKVQNIEEAIVKPPEKAVTRSKSRSKAKPASTVKKTASQASKRK